MLFLFDFKLQIHLNIPFLHLSLSFFHRSFLSPCVLSSLSLIQNEKNVIESTDFQNPHPCWLEDLFCQTHRVKSSA